MAPAMLWHLLLPTTTCWHDFAAFAGLHNDTTRPSLLKFVQKSLKTTPGITLAVPCEMQKVDLRPLHNVTACATANYSLCHCK